MVYLVLKELLPLAEDVIIVISCLTKDMNSKTDLYRCVAASFFLYATFHYIDLLPRLGLNATRFFWLFSSFLLFSTPLLFSGPTPSACSARSTTLPCWARPSAT
jgi:hypothetical protein